MAPGVVELGLHGMWEGPLVDMGVAVEEEEEEDEEGVGMRE